MFIAAVAMYRMKTYFVIDAYSIIVRSKLEIVIFSHWTLYIGRHRKCSERAPDVLHPIHVHAVPEAGVNGAVAAVVTDYAEGVAA